MAAEMFDTLAFSKRLQAGGVPAAQADTHASAQGDQVIAYLLGQVATKADLVQLERIEASLDQMPTKADLDCFAKKADLGCLSEKEDLDRFATKADIREMTTSIREAIEDLAGKMLTEEKLLLLLELRDKKMTIRLGGMILAAVVALSTFMRFMQFTVGG